MNRETFLTVCSFLIVVLAVVAQGKTPLTAEELAYRNQHLGQLKAPDFEDVPVWRRLVAMAATAEDDGIADAILEVGKHPLDGYFSTNYDLLLFEFLQANPKFFVRSVDRKFGKSLGPVARRLVNETGEPSPASVRAQLDTIPRNTPEAAAAARLSKALKPRGSR